jgi:hypothetical protein
MLEGFTASGLQQILEGPISVDSLAVQCGSKPSSLKAKPLLSSRTTYLSGEVQRICGYLLFETEAVRATIQTMASVRKPVIVRKFSRDWCAGYAHPNFGQDAAALEILDLGGKVLSIGWETVKWVCYVRDFPVSSADQANPERLLHKRFAVRPRAAGLWLRMTLTDGDELEGLAANDRSLVEGPGLLLTPPDMRSNTQRIYVPRQAIQALEVVSLIGVTGRRRPEVADRPSVQPELFPGEPGA